MIWLLIPRVLASPCQRHSWYWLYRISGWLSPAVEDFRNDSRLPPSQWVAALQSNAASHWLGANVGSALGFHINASAQCWEMFDATNICFIFWYKLSTLRDSIVPVLVVMSIQNGRLKWFIVLYCYRHCGRNIFQMHIWARNIILHISEIHVIDTRRIQFYRYNFNFFQLSMKSKSMFVLRNVI